jgi:hypothetical protein
MSTELVTAPVLTFAGIDAAETFLNLPPALTDTQERAVIGQLRTAARGMPWWIGDFACHYRRKMELVVKAEEAAAKAEGRRPRDHADYADTLAAAWGVSAGHIRNVAGVSAFYPVSSRDEKLTWRHHAEAMRVVGAPSKDLKGAVALLTRAKEEGWECADVRQRALPASQLPTAPAEDNTFAFLDSADKWVNQSQDRFRSIDSSRAASLLTRFHALAEFIDHLRALSGLTGQNVKHINARFNQP